MLAEASAVAAKRNSEASRVCDFGGRQVAYSKFIGGMVMMMIKSALFFSLGGKHTWTQSAV